MLRCINIVSASSIKNIKETSCLRMYKIHFAKNVLNWVLEPITFGLKTQCSTE